MTVSSTLRTGDSATLPSARRTPLLVGTCEIDPGATLTLDPGDDVTGLLGGGRLAEAALLVHATTGGRVVVRRAVPTYGALPAVTHVGSGPAVTVALSSGSPGPLYPYKIKARVTVAGAGGAGQAAIAYDGVNEVETITIPAEPPAILRGTVDITAGAVLSAKHLDFTAPASKVITFATSPTTAQGVVDEFNSLAAAAPLAVRARLYQTTAGLSYLELYSTSGGAGVTVTMDASASDADGLLGFTAGASNLSATGSAAHTTLPFTGVDLVWPSGSYAVDDTYTIPLPGPTATVQAVLDAATAGIDDYREHPFGRIVVVDPPATNTIARSMSDALTSLCAASIADPNTPVYVDFAAGTALHTASSVKATNRANIATNDASMLAAFAGQSASYVRNRVHDDVYIAGAPELRPGTYRQSATFAAAIKIAGAAKIAANPGEGVIPGVTLLGPDQLTEARDDAAVTPHLGKLTATTGSWVLKSTSTREVKFDVCATMAGPTSRLRSPGAGVAVGLEILRIVFEKIELWEGQTPETDALSPKAIAPDDAETRANDLHSALAEFLTPADPNTPSNVSGDFTVRVTAPLLADDGASNVFVAYNPLGEIGLVNVVVTATAAKLATAA